MSEIHPWELRLLGKSPFKFVCVDIDERKSTQCDYCKKRIKWIFRVSDCDENKLKFGSECIKRVESANSILRLESEKAKIAAVEQFEIAAISEVQSRLDSDADWLKSEPSPYSNRSTRDWAEFCFQNGGRRKQMEVCRWIARISS